MEVMLCSYCRVHGINYFFKHCMNAITRSLDDISMMGFHCLAHEHIMLGQRRFHGFRIFFPQLSRAFDIRKEKGDSANRKAAHDNSCRASCMASSILRDLPASQAAEKSFSPNAVCAALRLNS